MIELQDCPRKLKKDSVWFMDSGCSRHMTGDSSLLSKIKWKDGASVTFGNNDQGKIRGYGTVKKDSVSIDKVAFVEGLKHNLISISQRCDKGHKVEFLDEKCIVKDRNTNSVKLIGTRKDNLYIVDFQGTEPTQYSCFQATTEDTCWLWHRRLSHLNFKTISKLATEDLVRGLSKTKFDKDKLCKPCQMGKQTKVSFKSKLINSNSVPLELIHMDLFGPIPTTSLGGKDTIL